MQAQGSTRRLLIGMAVVGVCLTALALALPPEAVLSLFSETGPVERASVLLWLGLATLALFALRPPTPGGVAGGIVSLACAAREMDWHRTLTGYSVLKPAFYMKEAQPASHRALAALAVLTLGVAAAALALRVFPALWRLRTRLPAWGFTTLIALATLVGSKALDRAPMVIEENFGLKASARTHAVVHALEEGYESILPVIFGIGVVQHARWRRGQGGDGTPA